MNNTLLYKLENINSELFSITSWDDVFTSAAYWAKIDKTYASNILLVHMAEQTTMCKEEDVDTFVSYLDSQEITLLLPNTTYPTWIYAAVEMQNEYLSR